MNERGLVRGNYNECSCRCDDKVALEIIVFVWREKHLSGRSGIDLRQRTVRQDKKE